VIVWELRNGDPIHRIDAGPHSANCVAIDTSGSVLAVGSADGTIKLFDFHTAELIAELQAHDDAVQAIVFDKLGSFLVSAGSDGTVRLWS
jgi:WD40 repeat protein